MNVIPAAAPLAQVNPLAAHGGGMLSLFSTHPPAAPSSFLSLTLRRSGKPLAGRGEVRTSISKVSGSTPAGVMIRLLT